MARIPMDVSVTPLSKTLSRFLELKSQGKVRDTYLLPLFPKLLLVVATDRMSIYDFVLNFLVSQKGEVLTAISVMWFLKLDSYKHHLLAFGSGIDRYLPSVLQRNAELQKRAMVVWKETPLPIECVARGHLTGSGLKDYHQTGMVCGHRLPAGLCDGNLISPAIFTPATKAKKGHDLNIPYLEVRKRFGGQWEYFTLALYGIGYNFYRAHDYVMPDTKFEFARNGCIIDEVLTPDSSRLWPIADYFEAQKQQRSPKGYDKQPVRDRGERFETPFFKDGKRLKLSELDTESGEHLDWVGQLDFGTEVPQETSWRFLKVCKDILGKPLGLFQAEDMKVRM